MQKIECAIGQRDGFSGAPPIRYATLQVFTSENFLRNGFSVQRLKPRFVALDAARLKPCPSF
ncbi:MAG TPA: hypothetical protein VLW84_05005 [Terriglobales bacterium]|nr:hypothetical protein [Terriglobales bacterium]